jgi:hypothetical protein
VRKKVMAIVFAVLAFSLIAASAATLGPINASDVGANTGVVGACDNNGVNVSFTTGLVGGVPRVTEAHLTGIANACDGLNLFVTLQDVGGNAIAPTAGPYVVSGNTADITGLNVDPLALELVYVVIG